MALSPVKPPRRAVLRRGFVVSTVVALLPWLLHGLAREVDRVFGLLLHTTLDVPDLVVRGLALLRPADLLAAAATWTLAGAAVWLGLAGVRARWGVGDPAAATPGARWGAAALCVAPAFLPLLARPLCSLLALVSLAVRPAYPYGLTLPVALTQDLGWLQDSAAAVTLAVALGPVLGLRWSAWLTSIDWRPRTSDVWLGAFLAYATLAPASARLWDMHPGNEPKYLRMGAALALDGGLDVTHIEAPIEHLPARSLVSVALAAPVSMAQAAGRLRAAWSAGRPLWSATPPEASVLGHLTVRGSGGGAYHVLAPGPGLLLAPTLRLDRALNRGLGRSGVIALTLLAWHALAALLVALTFRFASALSARPGLAAVVTGCVALLPPLLFYSFQFYPEIPAALLFVLVLERLLLGTRWDARAGWVLGLLVAALPWLHQKYLPLAVALAAWAFMRLVGQLAPGRALVALLTPLTVSFALFALYNFALTGSLRPDALFRVLGREGVGWATLPQGLLGLALDARYGLLPYVPLLAVGLIGLAWPSARARALRAALPAAAVYYLTVASAENWTGSISNLGRFVLPLVPLLAAGLVLVLADVVPRVEGRVWLGVLAAWSAGLALALWRDPRAANDCAELLATFRFADGHVYLPNLLLPAWSAAAPGLGARLAVAVLLLVLLGVALRGVAQRGTGGSATPALASLLLALLAGATLLERWPGGRRTPLFRDSLRLPGGVTLVVSGAGQVAPDGGLQVDAGDLRVLVRSPTPRQALLAEWRAPSGATRRVRLGLEPLADLTGRRGNREVLALARARWIESGRVTFALE